MPRACLFSFFLSLGAVAATWGPLGPLVGLSCGPLALCIPTFSAPLSHVCVTRVCRFEALAPPFFRCFLSSPKGPFINGSRAPPSHLALRYTSHTVAAAHHTHSHSHTHPPRNVHTPPRPIHTPTAPSQITRGVGRWCFCLLDGAARRRQPQYLSRGGDQVHPSMRPNDGSCPALPYSSCLVEPLPDRLTDCLIE